MGEINVASEKKEAKVLIYMHPFLDAKSKERTKTHVLHNASKKGDRVKATMHQKMMLLILRKNIRVIDFNFSSKCKKY